MENILIWDKVNRVKNTEVILHLWIWTDDIKKGGHNVMASFSYLSNFVYYLMFGFSLFHSATGGSTPIAITSSRRAHKCS